MQAAIERAKAKKMLRRKRPLRSKRSPRKTRNESDAYLLASRAQAVTSVEQVMKQVLLATIPGVAVLTWFFGPGTLVNIIFGSMLAMGFEAWALWLQAKTLSRHLKITASL